MKFGSVCSGIEAASVAFNPLGWEAAWFSEIEPFPCALLSHHYPSVPNYGDMTTLPARILAGEVEAPDILVGGTPCFTAGHMVLTASGYRAIESLIPGEQVMTHKGRMRKILRVGSKVEAVGRLSAVGMPDGIVCTEDHPFLSSRWRNQSTRRNGIYTKVETCSEPEWIAAKDLPGRQWCALSQAEATACKPDSRLFDERTAMYVAGMYLGDGWIRCWSGKKKRAVMLGINEAKYQKLLAIIGESTHGVSRERTSIKVSFWDTAFANWLDANFGRYSHLKTLPAWVMGHPHRDALLQGYLDTDGCVDGNKVNINSTSKSLAYGVCDLLVIHGWAASVAKIETPATCVIEGRTVKQRDYFQVRANHISTSRKARVRHGYMMRLVQAWEAAGEEMVFNIEVEEDNSFILNGSVVHNCQAFSVAGKRASLSDARGNLTLIFCEIANAIDTVRLSRGQQPCIILWENVPGVLGTRDNAFGCFLGELSKSGSELLPPPGRKWTAAGCVLESKRSIAWRTLDAQYFGLAQRRKRVFVIASARNGFDPAKVLFESNGVRRDFAPGKVAGKDFARSVRGGVNDGAIGIQGNMIGRSDAAGPNGIGVSLEQSFTPTKTDVHGVAAPSWPANIASRLNAHFGDKKGLENQHINQGAPLFVPAVIHGTQDPDLRINQAHTLGRNNGQENALVFALDSLSSNSMKSANPDSGFRAVDVAKTLDTSDQNPSKNQGGVCIASQMRVRRLTPRECERLQGFQWRCDSDYPGAWQDASGRWWSPDYTAIPWRKKPASDCPDSHRYKALGNSWAVPVVRWIGSRIDSYVTGGSAL